MSAIKTFMAITSVAGALAFSTSAYADTPVSTPDDETVFVPSGDPLPEDPNWVDTTPIPYDEGAPLPGGDPEPKDPNWVDDTKVPDEEGAPLPGGDPEPEPTKDPEPKSDPEPIRMVAAYDVASFAKPRSTRRIRPASHRRPHRSSHAASKRHG
jgi:hypothetical protein